MDFEANKMNAHKEAFETARRRRRACADWLKALMRPGQLKPATKEDLFDMARVELDINRSNFNDGWIIAIHEMGRQDWERPIPRTKSKR